MSDVFKPDPLIPLMCPHCLAVKPLKQIGWVDQRHAVPRYACPDCGKHFAPPVMLGTPLSRSEYNG